jgi:hypothetical protein
MVGYAIGLAVGFSAGLATGIAVGKKQKPWSELNPQEKKLKIVFMVVGFILFLAGVAAFFLVLK